MRAGRAILTWIYAGHALKVCPVQHLFNPIILLLMPIPALIQPEDWAIVDGGGTSGEAGAQLAGTQLDESCVRAEMGTSSNMIELIGLDWAPLDTICASMQTSRQERVASLGMNLKGQGLASLMRAEPGRAIM